MRRWLLSVMIGVLFQASVARAQPMSTEDVDEELDPMVERWIAFASSTQTRAGLALAATGLVMALPGVVLPGAAILVGALSSPRHELSGTGVRLIAGAERARGQPAFDVLGYHLEGAFALTALSLVPTSFLLLGGHAAVVVGAVMVLSQLPTVFRDDDEEPPPAGPMRTEERAVTSFTRIRTEGAVHVTVTQGATTGVRVTAEERHLPNVTTRVEGDTLVISTGGRFRFRTAPHVEVTAPLVEDAEIAGVGELTLSGISGETLRVRIGGAGSIDVEANVRTLTVEIAGAGNARLRGTAEELRASLSGAGSLDAKALPVRRAFVQVNGAGNASVAPTELLDASISGMGNVSYVGNPQTVRKDVSGLGRVHQE
ncbi:MAG: head GIN domain-containing protein [Myxococcota bacterium]